MKTIAGLAMALVAASAGAQTTIYNTFNEDDQSTLFDCCNALPVSTAKSELGVRNTLAVPFVPAADGRVGEIDVAVSYFSGTLANGNLVVSLDSTSKAGFPGKGHHVFHLSNIPAGGQCCVFTALPGISVPVHTGLTYWIAMKAKSTAYDGWNLNTVAASGPYAIASTGGGWAMTSGPLPAVRVIAK